ncbi:MAG: putative toxin-antitoxin system toxin component, PIN family [Prevotellaceae bacterium]|jgi:putative PIN family toxin of toxin-antitoxin system|nr:putative toxin-antitoxin system toxin component, PIN family [Prevotellaceae bacterium]
MSSKHKVVVDTNLWVSFLLTKRFNFIDEVLDSGVATLVFSQELLAELLDVVARPKLKSFFATRDLDTLLYLIEDKALFYEVGTVVSACRDEKDNFLLALAQESGADYLLTGDKDLLVLKKFGLTNIITLATYKDIVELL